MGDHGIAAGCRGISMAILGNPCRTLLSCLCHRVSMVSSFHCHGEVHGIEKFMVRRDRPVAGHGVPWRLMARPWQCREGTFPVRNGIPMTGHGEVHDVR